MIRVKWENEPRGFSLTVKGHAEGAPAGENLVCAGVSTLLFAAAEAASRLTHEDALEGFSWEADHPGEARLSVTARRGREDAVTGLRTMLESGLALLQAEESSEHREPDRGIPMKASPGRLDRAQS